MPTITVYSNVNYTYLGNNNNDPNLDAGEDQARYRWDFSSATSTPTEFSDDDAVWAFLGSDANELIDTDNDGTADTVSNITYREVLVADDGSGDEVIAYGLSGIGSFFVGDLRSDTTWSTKFGEARDFDLSDDTPGAGDTFVNTDGYICFASSVRIQKDNGEVAAGKLSVGDRISKLEEGYCTVRWIGRRKVKAAELAKRPKLRPVRIEAGALGNGLPKRDLLVSRQHRIMVTSQISELMFGERKALIAAIKLTELPGIYVDYSVEEIEYVHLLFEQHEIIYAEGAPSESLYTGPEALRSVSREAREEILTIFPNLTDRSFAPEPVRFIPSNIQQKQIVARHLKNNTPVCL